MESVISFDTKKADNAYKSYCRNDVLFFDVLDKIINNGVIDTSIFHKIRIFSESILRDFNKLHDIRTDPRDNPNDPTIYLKRINNGSSRRNTKYVPLSPLCKNDQKDEDGNAIKCFKMYDTQLFEKHFIPQLYHIVLKFGILNPLGISNFSHIKLETDGILNQFSLQKFDKFNLKTGETKTPDQHISDELDDWTVNFKHRVEVRKSLFNNNSPIPPQTPSQIRNDCVKEKFMRVIMNFTHLGITSDNITAIFRRLDTVCRLRLFDLFVCNSYNIPENTENVKHSIVYLDTVELRNRLEKIIISRNLAFSLSEDEEDSKNIVKIPPIDNILLKFINMELVLKNPR